jgi:hypothetical protein
MKTKTENGLNKIYFLLVAGFVMFFPLGMSNAASNLTASQGDTPSVTVRSIDKNLLTTADGRFAIAKETKIYDENGKALTYRDIKPGSMVRIAFKRIGGQLTAMDIVVKEAEPPKMSE